MNIFKKIWSRIMRPRTTKTQVLGHLDTMSQNTGLKCPKCHKNLYSMSGKAAGLSIYICRNCDYQGNIGLKESQMQFSHIKSW